MTEKVLVRFTEEDMLGLQREADRQGVSVPALLRELSRRAYLPQAS